MFRIWLLRIIYELKLYEACSRLGPAGMADSGNFRLTRDPKPRYGMLLFHIRWFGRRTGPRIRRWCRWWRRWRTCRTTPRSACSCLPRRASDAAAWSCSRRAGSTRWSRWTAWTPLWKSNKTDQALNLDRGGSRGCFVTVGRFWVRFLLPPNIFQDNLPI